MEKENKLGTMPIPKLLATTALPIVIAMLIQALYNIVDSIFVAKIGEDALTAVSLAFPAQNLLIAVGVGLGMGINAVLSRNLGAGNKEQANDTANHAVFIWIVLSLIFAVIGFTLAKPFFMMQTDDKEIIDLGAKYFRICVGLAFGLFGQFTFERILQATGRAMETMITQASGAILNIILDPIFIFGFHMGISGAAYATVLGQIIACFMTIYINERNNHDVKIRMKNFKPRLFTLKQIFSIAFPAIVMQSLTSVMNFFMNLILIGFTSTATAIFGIYYKLQSFFFMPLYGTTNAMVPIVAYNFGAKRKERMKEVTLLAMKVAGTLMILGTVVFLSVPKLLLLMFSANSHMLTIGIPALRIISLNFPFAGIAVVCSSFFQASGKATYSLMVSLIRQIFILLPVAFLFSLTGILQSVWWAFLIAEFIGFVISIIIIKKLIKKFDF